MPGPFELVIVLGMSVGFIAVIGILVAAAIKTLRKK
jgi:hypothetical protein